MIKYKPLDIIQSKDYKYVGVIMEDSSGDFSVDWLGIHTNLKSAWWTPDEISKDFVVIANIPNFLVKGLAHPFGNNYHAANIHYPYNVEDENDI